MMRRSTQVTGSILAAVLALGAVVKTLGAELREAMFTQVVNTVNVTNPQGNVTRPAQVNSKYATPDLIRTGLESRAELTAADKTVTRIGSNTIFSFKPEGRGINLQQGSVLFNSPTGRGGGTIQTAAATASVLGTTIIVSTTSNGGFKLLVLEGKARATLQNGRTVDLRAGQMTFILPGATRAPVIFEFRLSKQNEGSLLLGGFTQPLPGQEKVEAAIAEQTQQIADGKKDATDLMIGEVVNGDEVQVIDANTLQAALNSGNSYADLIDKFRQSIAVDRSVSSTLVDPANTLYMPSADALRAVAQGVNANGNISNPPNTSYLFGAKNLTISASVVDLSPYNGVEEFIFYGDQSITLGGTNLGTYGGKINVHSNGDLSISGPITANAGELNLEAYSSQVDVNYSLSNTGGSLALKNNSGHVVMSGSSLTFSGVATGAPAISINAAGQVVFLAGTTTFMASGSTGETGVSIQGGDYVNFDNCIFANTSLNVNLYSGTDVNIRGTSITAHAVDVTAAGGVGFFTVSNSTIAASADLNLISYGTGSYSSEIVTSTLSSANNMQAQANDLWVADSRLDGNNGLKILSNHSYTVSNSTLMANDLTAQSADGNMMSSTFSAFNTVTVTGGSFTATNSFITLDTGGSTLTLSVSSALTLTGTWVKALGAGDVNLFGYGSVLVANSTVSSSLGQVHINSLATGSTSGAITISNSTLSGYSSSASAPAVCIEAATSLSITNTRILVGGVDGVGLESDGSAYLDTVTYSNPSLDFGIRGNTGSYVGTTATILNSNIAANSYTVDAVGTITSSGNVVTASNSRLYSSGGSINSTGDTVDAPIIHATTSAVVGTVNLTTGTFTASSNLVVSGANVNVSSTNFNGSTTGVATFSGSMAASSSTMSNAITMSNTNFLGFTTVNMAAYTINLSNVDFGAGQSVYLNSGLTNGGTPTFGTGSAVPGRVNFLGGVTYGGADVNTPGGWSSNGGNIHLN